MIIEQLTALSLELRKQRSPNGAFLSTVLSDTKMLAKNEGNREATDEDALRVIKKYLKGIEETQRLCAENGNLDVPAKVLTEKTLLESFLPKLANESDVLAVILETTGGAKDPKLMGKVMGALKAKFGNTLDSKTASEMVKNALK